MKHYQIASTDLSVSRIALGCMKLARTWDGSVPVEPEIVAHARKLIDASLELGINFFDHADIYCGGRSETAFGNAMKEVPGLRDKIVLQSKCGVRFRNQANPNDPPSFDFTYNHITWSVEQILKRLSTDRLDILLLHRPDPLVEPAEVAKAFDELQKSGKVRYFGVSNHGPMQIELLRRTIRQPLVVNQIQLSLAHVNAISEAVSMNQTLATYTAADGLIDYCRINNILIQAWAPNAQGRLAHPRPDSSDKELRIAGEVAKLAELYKVTTDAIVLAFLLRHPAGIQPVVGTTNVERLRDGAQADTVTLTHKQWFQLFTATRGGTLP